MKRYKAPKFFVLLIAGALFLESLTACTPGIEQPTSNTTTSGTQQSQTETEQTEIVDTRDANYGLPDALFYSPNYRQLTSLEKEILINFTSYIGFKNTTEEHETIRYGTFVYCENMVETDKGVLAHPIYWTPNAGGVTKIIYLTDEIYQDIVPVLKRSAEQTKLNGGVAYKYKYGALFNGLPYDENELTVLQTSLYKNYIVGYYKEEFKAFFGPSEEAEQNYNNLSVDFEK